MNFNSTFNKELQEEYGGRSIKLAEKVNLGIPDTLHICGGILTFIEIKISDSLPIVRDGKISVKPWDSINDIRQYEVARNLSRQCLTLYVIYYSEIQMAAVLTMKELSFFDQNKLGDRASIELEEGDNLVKGHGIERVIELMKEQKRSIYERLKSEL